jgi:hypothetical protein
MEMDEKLIGKQSKLDKNKNGKIDSQDFKALRGEKNEEVKEADFRTSSSKISRKDWKHFDADGKELKFEPRVKGGYSIDKEGKRHEARYGKKEDQPKEFRPGVDLGKSFENFKKMKDIKESECSECGGMITEEGMCNECGYGSMKESKKRIVRLTESQLIDAIKNIVKESVPGLSEYKKAYEASGNVNKTSVEDVSKKMKDYLTFDGNDNPEFPNQIKKGSKMAINNTKEQDDFVDKERGRALQDLKYDHEPSEKFKERMKMAIEGDTLMGNGNKDAGNVVHKKETAERILRAAKNKKDEMDKRVLYNKEKVPVKFVKENKISFSSILDEEIDKIKNIQSYNKKSQ